jgi:hypothetical protein
MLDQSKIKEIKIQYVNVFRNNFLTILEFKKKVVPSNTSNLVCTHALLLINFLIFPWSLFFGKNFVSINWPVDAMSWPTTQNGKVVQHTLPFTMSRQPSGRLTSYNVFQATIVGSNSYIWTNLQDFIWQNIKEEAIRSYN